VAILNFQFLTSNGITLDLVGEAISWSDEVGTGVAEHQILKRNGALHQLTGTPPKKHTFACCIRGQNVADRYQRLVDVITAYPVGVLVHPRLRAENAVCEGISASETPGQEQDSIAYTIRFSETGLHDLPKPSPVSAASAAAAESANTVTLATSKAPGVLPQAQALQSATAAFLTTVQSVQAQAVSSLAMTAQLQNILTASQAVANNTAINFAVRASAALVYSQCQAAYNRLLGNTVPIVAYTVQQSISLARLAQQLYRGKARAQEALILQNNRISRPFQIPAQTVLLVPQPDVVRATA
jgi:prophage DNA circulation protein